jgi:hypothetical protein
VALVRPESYYISIGAIYQIVALSYKCTVGIILRHRRGDGMISGTTVPLKRSSSWGCTEDDMLFPEELSFCRLLRYSREMKWSPGDSQPGF